mgnify:CR=1 FL=1
MSTSQSPNKQKYLKSFISGGCAGIVAKSVIAPFDRVKILFVVIIYFHYILQSFLQIDKFTKVYIPGCNNWSNYPLQDSGTKEFVAWKYGDRNQSVSLFCNRTN